MENNLVKVLLWGQEVGVMYWDASASRAIFEYSPDYLRIGVDIAPLTCSIQSIAAKKPILGNKEKLYRSKTIGRFANGARAIIQAYGDEYLGR